MSTFITELPSAGRGLRLAVKDIIGVEGVPTTGGSRATGETAAAAAADAACLRGARQAGTRIVGKTNLHELALGTSGINAWSGTPVNPLGRGLAPGGSSSGSAVAVAAGSADIAFGTDTGGSIRLPSACCGIAGLKTTWGRIPVAGVWDVAPSLDTVGPIGASVRDLIVGMQLLEPGFATRAVDRPRIARFRPGADPRIDAAIDRALAATGWPVHDLALPDWDRADQATLTLIAGEGAASFGALMADRADAIGEDVRRRLQWGGGLSAQAMAAARATQRQWTARFAAVFRAADFVVLPTMRILPPPIDEGHRIAAERCTLPVNLAGVPALTVPVPTSDGLPAGLQLVGSAGSEEQLLFAGCELEAAIASL